MQEDYAPTGAGLQAALALYQTLRQRLKAFVAPLLSLLDTHIDARLVESSHFTCTDGGAKFGMTHVPCMNPT
jgi:hypothetical protein